MLYTERCLQLETEYIKGELNTLKREIAAREQQTIEFKAKETRAKEFDELSLHFKENTTARRRR